MVKCRLLIFCIHHFLLALGQTDDDDTILNMFGRSEGFRKNVERLKRLYSMDQIQFLYDDVFRTSDAIAFYCYVMGDEILATCYTFGLLSIEANALVQWKAYSDGLNFEDRIQIWNRESKDYISLKKGDDPIGLVQIEEVAVSESHQNRGIGTEFLKKVLVHLRSQSKHTYFYINAEKCNIPAVKCYRKVFEYEGTESMIYNQPAVYWVVK